MEDELDYTNMTNEERKNELLMREVILEHHPVIKELEADPITKDSYKRVFAILSYKRIRTEMMVEEANSYVGGYEHTPKSGYDHGDFSDTKVISSFYRSPKRACVEINGVETKVGALRCLIFNQPKNKLHYVYLPREVWEPRSSQGAGHHRLRRRLRFYYDVDNDQYEWNMNETLEEWRFDTFEECAKMSTDNDLYNNVELLFYENCKEDIDDAEEESASEEQTEEVTESTIVEDAA